MDALVKPLEVEVETASPFPDAPTWVRNEATHACRGVYHAISCNLSGLRMGEWKTRCGWRFAGIPTIAVDVAPPSVADWERTCKRCAKARQQELEAEHKLMLKSER